MNEISAEIILLEAEREIDRLREQRDRAVQLIAQALGYGGVMLPQLIEEFKKLENEISGRIGF